MKLHPKEPPTRRCKILRAAMMLLLMSILTLPNSGCATKVVEISSDRQVRTVKAGVAFTPSCDGKFVPEARWNEMLRFYIRESEK